MNKLIAAFKIVLSIVFIPFEVYYRLSMLILMGAIPFGVFWILSDELGMKVTKTTILENRNLIKTCLESIKNNFQKF